MKKSIILMLFFLLTFSQTVLAAEEPESPTPILQLQTNYPSPIGNYQNLKTKALLTVIVFAIVVGLVGSYLTFEQEVEFISSLFK